MMARHLLLDDREIDSMKGFTWRISQPAKHPLNPLIHCDKPWEGLGIQTYGTVIYDESQALFKIWYLTHSGPSSRLVHVDGVQRPANMTLLAYATSQDGIHWTKPDLGQVEFQGSRHNNLLRIGRLNVEGASILYEPWEKDPYKRYKAFYWEHGSGKLEERADGSRIWGEGEGDGMWVSFSPDGVHWHNYEDNPVIPLGSDTGQSVLWDPRIRRYVAFGRFGAGGRKVARTESRDFLHWTSPRLVLEPDEEDGPDTQFYGISVNLYEGVYLGLLWVFHIDPAGHLGGGKDKGNIDVQLVSSKDGASWRRLGDRVAFLPNGSEGEWDSAIVQTATRFLLLGDRILIYYSGGSKRHGEAVPKANSQIGLATLPKDRFLSLSTGRAGGWVLTKPLIKAPGDLHLNLDAGRGWITVEMEADKGKTWVSEPITLNSLDAVVKWTDRVPQASDGKEVRLLFRGVCANLYSYWFEPRQGSGGLRTQDASS